MYTSGMTGRSARRRLARDDDDDDDDDDDALSDDSLLASENYQQTYPNGTYFGYIDMVRASRARRRPRA